MTTMMTHTEAVNEMRTQLRELRKRARELHENRRLLTLHIGEAVVQKQPTTRLHVERRGVDDSLEETYSAINVLETRLRNCGTDAALFDLVGDTV